MQAADGRDDTETVGTGWQVCVRQRSDDPWINSCRWRNYWEVAWAAGDNRLRRQPGAPPASRPTSNPSEPPACCAGLRVGWAALILRPAGVVPGAHPAGASQGRRRDAGARPACTVIFFNQGKIFQQQSTRCRDPACGGNSPGDLPMPPASRAHGA